MSGRNRPTTPAKQALSKKARSAILAIERLDPRELDLVWGLADKWKRERLARLSSQFKNGQVVVLSDFVKPAWARGHEGVVVKDRNDSFTSKDGVLVERQCVCVRIKFLHFEKVLAEAPIRSRERVEVAQRWGLLVRGYDLKGIMSSAMERVED